MQREAMEVKSRKYDNFKLSRVLSLGLVSGYFPQRTIHTLPSSHLLILPLSHVAPLWQMRYEVESLFKGFSQRLRKWRLRQSRACETEQKLSFAVFFLRNFPIHLIRIFGFWSSTARFAADIPQFDYRWHVIEYLCFSQNRICEKYKKGTVICAV